MTYRWDRRRHRKYRALTKQRLDPIDYIFLITTFVIWFFTLRFIFIFQTTTAPCVEAWVLAGKTHDTASIFESIKFISYAMLALWGTLSLTRWTQRTSKPISYIWQTILGLPIILLIFAAYMLAPTHSLSPPDGVMRVHYSVVANISGEDVYSPNLVETDVFGEWKRGAANPDSAQSEGYRPYSCIWLDENKVSLFHTFRDNELGALSYEDRFKQQRRDGIRVLRFDSWYQLKNKALKDLRDNRFKAADVLHARQQYRPLTVSERARFQAKQKCTKDISNYGQHRSYCEYQWYIDWESYHETPEEQLPEVIRERLNRNAKEFE